MGTETSRHSYRLLTALALLASLAGGVLVVAQFEAPDVLDFLSDPIRAFDKPQLVLPAATGIPIILLILAYVSTLRARKNRCPTVAIYFIGLGLMWMVLAYATTFDAEMFFTPIVLGIAGAALLVLAVGVRVAEIVVGKLCTVAGDGLLKKEKWQTASNVLAVARCMLPTSRHVARNRGLALYELGEAEQALEILVAAYKQGERDTRVVRTLADSVFQLPEDLASQILADALELEPKNAKFGRKLVDLHLRQQNAAEALPVLEKFCDSDNIEDVCLLGRLNAEQGNIERALQLSRRSIELEGSPYKRTLADLQILAMQAPENIEVLLTLAELNEKIKNREEAASWYLNLLDIKADNSEARRRLIRVYRQLGKPDQAMPHYRALLRQEPESPDVALEYGQLLEDRQDFEKAYKVFEAFAQRAPEDHRFAYHCAVNLFGMGRLSEASEIIERARANATESERARIQALRTRIRAARVEHELGAMREQAHRSGASLDLRLQYIERLNAYSQAEEAAREMDLLLEEFSKDRDRIVGFLEKMLEKDEQHFVMLNLLADIRLKERDFDRCHALYEKMAAQSLHPDEILADGCRQILRLQPSHLPSLKSHSRLLLKGGHHREAAQVLGKILDLSPQAREDLLPMLFEVYYQLGDSERAITYGEELLQGDTSNLNLHLRMNELFIKRDDHKGSIRILQRALDLAPDNRELQEMLKEAKARLRESRLGALRTQLENSPDQPDLLHEMGDIHVEFQRLNDAITSYQRAGQHAEGNLRNLCLAKLAHCLACKQMFDLADETLREVDVRDKAPDPQHLSDVKLYLYNVGGLFEMDEQFDRALQIYKKLFKIDAGYKDIVGKIEMLSHLVR